MSDSTFLTKEARLDINERTINAADVNARYTGQTPKVRRNTHIFDCPQCQAREGLECVVSGNKAGVFKCFHCDLGGKGGPALLQTMHRLDWQQAYLWLAQEYQIDLPEAAPTDLAAGNRRIAEKKITYRDLQLQQSGIPISSQVWPEPTSTGHIERSRYTAGTLTETGEYTAKGDDMVLHYVDLDCRPIIYAPKKGKPRPLVRVRYKHPDLHLDREGRPIKYRSPYDSGSHLWLPMHIIKAYQRAATISTLYVVEGEKKADKMCLHGLDAVGIMGIHNLAMAGEMPRTFEMIISKCDVKEVVFVLDSDWLNISTAAGKPVDQRPRTFLRAVQKFREYFYGFRNSGIDLRIFMLAGKSDALKGMDDLLSALEADGREKIGQPGELAADIATAIGDPTGAGQHVQCHNIHPLRVSEYQLAALWALDDPSKFFAAHLEQLRELGEFKYGKITYFFNQDSGQIEMAQQILPQEKFWDIETYPGRGGRDVKEVKFNYDKIRRFLINRGIGLFEHDPGQYRMVRRERHLMHDLSPQWIQRYVVEFVENALRDQERDDVVQMLLRGNTQFLGPNNLSYMFTHNPEWLQPRSDEQIMVFRNCFWRITADLIEQRPLSELQGTVWSNQVVQFDAEYLGHPLLEVERNAEGWNIKEAPECNGEGMCELYDYVRCTSLFAWEKLFELRRDPADGAMKYFALPEGERPALTAAELRTWKMHIATKLIAWGYKLRTYRDRSNMRVIICMDGLESAVGRSQGGSGKSIFAMATEHCQPLFYVDGKTADLRNDRFLYHGVDERTREIVFDDVRVNFDFELLFGQITSSIRVKPFQGAPITIPAPVFTITTNHAVNGEGNSFKRRQYFLGFSNFFNEHRTPAHYYGHQMFQDWDAKQWNLYYNLMASCLQTYMRFQDLGRFAVESDDIERRRLRQQIGEDFLDFADTYFTEGYMLNRQIEKTRILNDYLEQFPGDRRFMDVKRIKNKCETYAKFRNLNYNPGAGPDGRIKSAGQEFICLANDKFNLADPGEKIFPTTVVNRQPAEY